MISAHNIRQAGAPATIKPALILDKADFGRFSPWSGVDASRHGYVPLEADMVLAGACDPGTEPAVCHRTA